MTDLQLVGDANDWGVSSLDRPSMMDPVARAGCAGDHSELKQMADVRRRPIQRCYDTARGDCDPRSL